MINAIKNLYQAQNLNGEFLLQPLKVYHGFFVKKIADSSGLTHLAWRIAHIFSGIVAYPLFGVLAAMGLAVKVWGVAGVKKHNDVEKGTVNNVLKNSLGIAPEFTDTISESLNPPGWEMKVVREFKINRQNYNDVCNEISQEIDKLTQKFTKVYYSSSGAIEGNNGEITAELQIMTVDVDDYFRSLLSF